MPAATDRGWGAPCKGDLVTITLPVSNGPWKLRIRKELVAIITFLVAETERRGYKIRNDWSWTFACRQVRGGSSWSNHSWGIAIDLNAPKNGMIKRNPGEDKWSPRLTDMPKWLPELWKAHGFGWGGDYARTSDAMHFEFMGSPAQAASITAKLGNITQEEDDLTPEQAKKLDDTFALGMKNHELLLKIADQIGADDSPVPYNLRVLAKATLEEGEAKRIKT